MNNFPFDISLRRFSPIWLVAGAVMGREVGLISGLSSAFWYFSQANALIAWQIIAAILCALFISFLMTSSAPYSVKGAILGLGLGFALTAIFGEIWIAFQSDRSAPGLTGMNVSEGIFYDWLYTHNSWLGLLTGFFTGRSIQNKKKKVLSQNIAEGQPVG
jgi:hypothetical protein